MANISAINFETKTDKPAFTFLVGSTEVSIPLSENLDLEEEKTKAEEEIKYLKGFLISIDKKLLDIFNKYLDDNDIANKSKYIENLIRKDMEERGKNVDREF